jgi:hypothetical protein
MYYIYIYIQINISSIATSMKLNRDQLFCHRSPFQIASLDTNGPCTSIDHRLQPDMDRTPRTPPGETHRTPCLVMIRCDESMRQPAFMPQKSTKYVTSQAWVLQTYKGNVIWRGSTLEGPGLVCHGFFHLHACTQKTVFRVFWSSLHISGGRTVSKCNMKSQFWKVNHVNLQSTHSGTLFWGTKPDSPTTLAKLPIHCQVPHAACEWMKSPVQVQQYAVKCGAHIPEHLL